MLQNETILNLIELGTIIAEIILIILYCRKLNVHTVGGKFDAILGYTILFIPLCILSLSSVPPWMRILYSIIGIMFLFKHCYGLSIPYSLYLAALFLTLSVIADIGCSYCMSLIGISNEGYTGQAMDRSIGNANGRVRPGNDALNAALIARTSCQEQETRWALEGDAQCNHSLERAKEPRMPLINDTLSSSSYRRAISTASLITAPVGASST